MLMLLVALGVMIAMAVIVIADFVRAFLWSRSMRVAERETARAGRLRGMAVAAL